MPIFGRKKEPEKESKPIEKLEVPLPVDIPNPETAEPIIKEEAPFDETAESLPENFNPLPEFEKLVIEEKSKPISVPLFVKLEKYEDIINSLGEMRSAIDVIKDAFSNLNEIDRIRYENMKIINDTVELINKKLEELDKEFTRPDGVEGEQTSEAYKEELNNELSDFKNHLDQLKSEMKNLA